MPLLDATPGEGTMMVGVFDVCAEARPGAVTAAATASAMNFLIIENVSSTYWNPRQPDAATRLTLIGLLQFCQSNLSSSITNVIYYSQSGDARCICATTRYIHIRSAGYEQVGERQPGVRRPHERLSNQKRTHAGLCRPVYVLSRQYAALGYRNSWRQNQRCQRKRRFEPGFESTEVAIVDPDERSRQLKGEIELGAIVDLDQYGHPERLRRCFEVPHPGQIERGDDEQYAVGAEDA